MNGASEHQRRLNETRQKVADALDRSVLSPENKRAYGKAIHEVLDKLTPTAFERHVRNTKGYRFYDGQREMHDAFFKKYPKAPVMAFGGVFDADGVLHLDGPARVEGKLLSLPELYAHELTHSIDGNRHEISSSEGWREAWAKDVNYFRTQRSHESATEAFSEFGEMLLGDPRFTRKMMKKAIPNCFRAWEANGL